ncbi:hypothetical protein GDO86_006090 [Hymenochirus boettgeri]|uniref:Peptidase M60 domain-containing protein n=1 Tax=Hymenochirus boettgeri TaxID=247094 RepID=A0A8T2J4M3_9PIPI|nr:hypothetical protein GDO86_006090 [Hymenochirus boettgeri]
MAFDKDYSSLVHGVGSLDFSGNSVPCKLLITGDTAFPVLVTPGKDVLIAASRYGKGKVVTLAHENYLNMKEFMVFLQNAVSWLSPNPDAVIGVESSLAVLETSLTASRSKVQTTTGLTQNLGVFCTNKYDESNVQEMISFIRNGGGLLIGAQAISWSQTQQQKNVLEHFPGNKIISVSGVYFTDGSGEKGKFSLSETMPWNPIYTNFPFSLDLKQLFEGVPQLDISGSSVCSDLLLHGALTFPVGLTNEKQCFVGAAYYGKGRVVVVTHEGYFFKPELKTFIINSIKWLDIGQKRKIGVNARLSNLTDLLKKENIPSSVTNLVPGLSVYCCQSYGDSEAKAIQEFVAEGGGLLIGGHAWYWAIENSNSDVLIDYPGNKILNKFGISILERTLPQAIYKAVSPDEESDHYCLPKALGYLQSALNSGSVLKPPLSNWIFKLRQDLTYILRLPPSPVNSSLQHQFVELMQTCPMPNVSVTCPIQSNSMQGLILCVVNESCGVNQTVSVQYPGQETPVTVDIDATNPGGDAWRSTGLYIAPKKTVVFEFPTSAVKKGLQVQIGCQSDDLNNLNTLYRAPVVVRSTPVLSERLSISCYWGGLIYIIVHEKSSLGKIQVKVYGAEPAPTYIKGKTSLDSWLNSICKLPAPWAELITENIVLTVPSDAIRSLKDPESLLSLWDKVMVAVAELAAIPIKFPRPERIVADVQISAGFMHSGYPVMCHSQSAKDMTNLESIQKNGMWGFAHELGHNQQKSVWEFPPYTTEATNNLWSVYVHETVLGIPRDRAHPSLQPQKRAACIQKYIQNKANLDEWSVWTALETYLQLQEGFGWEPFKKVFKEYQSITGISNDNNIKMNLWVEKFSKAVNRNLVPFFQTWGWPIDDKTRSKLSTLPVWEKDPMKQYEKV